ncbi:hypothetical protein [Streptococcus equi]|uniref:hypothetical protein n=1 Tax=Streptococcus equi TaxID=1336 RepID=UPI001E364326|nr:hypothetical protein [Streptococcus equi]
MKRNIKKEMVMARKLAIIVIATGILFALIACILFFKKDILQVFPRMDIAWVGFLVVAILLFVSGIWVFSISGKKQDWINETDEREFLIRAKANMVGYVTQTTLLGIVFFLLVFMGYLNKVSGFSIIGVILISDIVSWIYHLYLRKVE